MLKYTKNVNTIIGEKNACRNFIKRKAKRKKVDSGAVIRKNGNFNNTFK